MKETATSIDLTWLWSTLSAAGSAVITWFFTRRKQTADAIRTEIENVEKIATMWRETAERLEKKVELLSKEIEILEQRMDTLHAENQSLRLRIETLTKTP